jgi:2,5-diketo-D-gluconate reductase B
METITTQGVAMPRLGFGTFRMPGAAAQSVSRARSRSAIGISTPQPCTKTRRRSAPPSQPSGATRTELFVTTKVWHDQLGHDLHRNEQHPTT